MFRFPTQNANLFCGLCHARACVLRAAVLLRRRVPSRHSRLRLRFDFGTGERSATRSVRVVCAGAAVTGLLCCCNVVAIQSRFRSITARSTWPNSITNQCVGKLLIYSSRAPLNLVWIQLLDRFNVLLSICFLDNFDFANQTIGMKPKACAKIVARASVD